MDDARRSDTAERAKAIYEERIRPLVEAEHFGKVVSIEVNSGDYEIAQDRWDHLGAIHRLRARHESPVLFGLRIGVGPVARIGGFKTARKAAP